jgi:NAD(P)-dependent dehydrogenase (short-subunit alcohol dehydrogenase family)
MISLCESITVAEGASGVTATAISPGYVDTDMTTWVHDRIPAETMIRTSDVAEMALSITRLSSYAVVPNVVVARPGSEVWRG